MNTTLHVNKDKSEKGFTLIEVLISLAILSIGILAVASLQVTASLQSRNSLEIMDASAIASSQMEGLMLLLYDDAKLNIGTHYFTDTIPLYKYNIPIDQYSIQWTVGLTDIDSDGNPDIPESKTINITVTRNNSSRTAEFVFLKHNDSDEL